MIKHPFLVISASAGTGKTTRLCDRYLQLLAEGAPPREILATTFTRKAAREIRERILERLCEAATGEPLWRAGPVAPANACQWLARLVREPDQVSIGTIDSFFARLVRCFETEIGLPPGWGILPEEQGVEEIEHKLGPLIADRGPAQEAIVHLVRGRPARDLYEELLGSLLEAYDLHRQAPPGAWMHLSPVAKPSKKEVAEAKHVIANTPVPLTKDGQPRALWSGALPALAALAAASDWDALLQKGLGNVVWKGKTSYDRYPIPPDLLSAIGVLIALAGAEEAEGVLADNAAMSELLTNLVASVDRARRLSGQVRFADVAGLITGHLEPEELYYRLDARISHLLLDEFQDTSVQQWDILRPLADEIVSDSTRGRSFFCVGDGKQSIYGWRGGSPRILAGLHKAWPQVTCEAIALTHRCSEPVVSAVNKAMLHLGDVVRLRDYPAALKQWKDAFSEHGTSEKCPGWVGLEGLDADNRSMPTAVAAKVASLLEPAGARGRTVGVLVQRNRLVRPIVAALRALGYAASEEGGSSLADDPWVSRLLSAITLADHPGHSAAAYHVAGCRLGSILLAEVNVDAAANPNWWSEPAVRGRISHATRSGLATAGLTVTLSRWFRAMEQDAPTESRRRVEQLLAMAAQADAAPGRLSDFVRQVRDTSVDREGEERIRVLTTHKAKGLEFDVVVYADLLRSMAGMGKGILARRDPVTDRLTALSLSPGAVGRKTIPEISAWCHEMEEDCVAEALGLLYVAMTRARRVLWMVYPAKSKSNGLCHRDVLLQTLANDPSHTARVAFEAGSPDWHLKVEDKPAVTVADPGVLIVPPGQAIARRTVPALTRVAPSDHDEWTGPASGSDLESAAAMEKGTRVHESLSSVRWLNSATLLSDEAKPYLADERVRAVLCPEHYAPWNAASLDVWCEKAFAVVTSRGLLCGKFDRVVVGRDAAGRPVRVEVLDYKTDRVSPADVPDRAAFYRSQMVEYRTAIGRLLGVDESVVRLTLLFLSPGIPFTFHAS